MRPTMTALATAAALTLSVATVALAQSPRYTGPSNVPLMTVQQLLATGHDDQLARLQGRIVSHEGRKRYVFEDASGRITAKIDDKHFPAGQTVSAEQRVELTGEFEKDRRKTEFDVDRMTLLP